jgi:Ca2+-binding EF-hand superfamily protein
VPGSVKQARLGREGRPEAHSVARKRVGTMPQRTPARAAATVDALKGAGAAARELAETLSDAAFVQDELDATGPPAVPDAVVAEVKRRSPGSPAAEASLRPRRRSSSGRSPSSPASPTRRAWEAPAHDDTIGAARSCNARVRSLEEMDDAVQFLKRKFRAQAYSPTRGEDPAALFKHFDRDNSGGLSLDEFRRAARRIGHVRPSQMSDEELRNLFVHIDVNKPTTLTQAESELDEAKAELAAVRSYDVQAAEALSADLARRKEQYQQVYEQWEAAQATSIIDINELTNFVWDQDHEKIAKMREPVVEQQRVQPPTPERDPQAVGKLRTKFRSISYSYMKGQDAEALFKRFDRDGSGGLSLDEFLRASRKAGHIQKWEMSDAELECLFDEIATGDTGVDGEPNISIQQLKKFVWPDEPSLSADSSVTPEKNRQDKTHDALLTNDEYEVELTFTPQILERQRARSAKKAEPPKPKANGDFHKQQMEKKERTEKRLEEQKDKIFQEAHTFKPDVKKLNRSTLAPRGTAGVLLIDAHKEPTAIPLYKDGHNHQSKVFDRLYTVSPGVDRHQKLKKKQEHMTAGEAMRHNDHRGLVRRAEKHVGAFEPIRHNPGGHQPGLKNKQAKLEETRIATLKKKLRAVSYSVDGQNPKELFRKFDRDGNGVLSLDEFKMTLIKGGQAHDMSEDEQEWLFEQLDTNADGDISVEELTAFVWGGEEKRKTDPDSPYEQLLPAPAAQVSPTPPRVYGLTRENPEAAGLVPHPRHKDHDETAPISERSIRSLKRELRTRGLDSTGTRFELARRLEKQAKASEGTGAVLGRSKPKLAPGSVRSAVRSLMQGYMLGEVSAGDLAAPAQHLIAQHRHEALQTMLLELDVACVNVESDGASTAEIRVALKKLFEYAEAAFQRGEREHVEMLLPKLEAVSEVLTRAESEESNRPATADVEAPLIDHDSDEVRKIKQKLRAVSYTSSGQDRAHMFRHFDRDNSGSLDFDEFVRAIRKVGHITAAQMSDEELGALFNAVDEQHGNTAESDGLIDVHELAEFVFGPDAEDGRSPRHAARKEHGGDDSDEAPPPPPPPPPSKRELRQLAAAVNKAKRDLDHAKASLQDAELPEMKETLSSVVAAHKKLYRQLHARWEEGTAAAAAAAAAAANAAADQLPPSTPQSGRDRDGAGGSISGSSAAAGSMIPRLSPHPSHASARKGWAEPEPEPEPELEMVDSPELSLMAASVGANESLESLDVQQLNADDSGGGGGGLQLELSPRLRTATLEAADTNASDFERKLSGLWTATGLCNGVAEEESFLLTAVAGVVPGILTLHGCSLTGNASPGGTLESFTLRGRADLCGLLPEAPAPASGSIEFTQQYDDPTDPTGRPDPDEEPMHWLAVVEEAVAAAGAPLAMVTGEWSGTISGTFDATKERDLSAAEEKGLRASLSQDLHGHYARGASP